MESEVTLYHGDCLDILPTLEAGSVDGVFTDPPYGIGYQSNASKRSRFNVLPNDDCFNIEEYWGDMITPVKRNGAIYVYTRWDIAYKWQKVIKPTNQIIIPRGKTSMGNLNDYSLDYEVILFKSLGKHKIDGTELGIRNNSHAKNPPTYKKRMGNLWSHIVSNEAWERTEHPTQKTIESAKWAILTGTNPGDTILDPFMGSGTTGVACVQTGRNFIGIEIDEGYYQIADKRIKEAQMQPRLDI